MATWQETYTRNYDRRVWTTLRVLAGDELFLTTLPGLAQADANRNDTTLQTKLRSPKSSLHDVIRSTDRTITITVAGVHKIMSPDPITIVPREDSPRAYPTAEALHDPRSLT